MGDGVGVGECVGDCVGMSLNLYVHVRWLDAAQVATDQSAGINSLSNMKQCLVHRQVALFRLPSGDVVGVALISTDWVCITHTKDHTTEDKTDK